jgi:hypothetical protein
MVWLGTWASGGFIIASNAWMQHPYRLRLDAHPAYTPKPGQWERQSFQFLKIPLQNLSTSIPQSEWRTACQELRLVGGQGKQKTELKNDSSIQIGLPPTFSPWSAQCGFLLDQ